jgi:FkbM family methyltransferase
VSLLDTFRFLMTHPLTADHRMAALSRFATWQVASRLAPGPVAVPFVNATRLLVSPGMAGATGSVYAGLHEFEDMSLVLHALRPGDDFVDAGANVGSYTIAACAAGAHTLAFEPVPETFTQLMDNVRLNAFDAQVTAHCVALGAGAGEMMMTTDQGCCNHVTVEDAPAGPLLRVPVVPLDAAIEGRRPVILKIDVEGFEEQVLEGAQRLLLAPSLLAVIVEVNGSGARYGVDDMSLHERLSAGAFHACMYAPRRRELTLLAERPSALGNVVYVRDVAALRERVRTAPTFSVLGQQI